LLLAYYRILTRNRLAFPA